MPTHEQFQGAKRREQARLNARMTFLYGKDEVSSEDAEILRKDTPAQEVEDTRTIKDWVEANRNRN